MCHDKGVVPIGGRTAGKKDVTTALQKLRYLIILDSAVRVEQKTQDFESESFAMGAEHSQMVKAAPIASDYDSKDCVFLPTPTAESRIIWMLFDIAPPSAANSSEIQRHLGKADRGISRSRPL